MTSICREQREQGGGPAAHSQRDVKSDENTLQREAGGSERRRVDESEPISQYTGLYQISRSVEEPVGKLSGGVCEAVCLGRRCENWLRRFTVYSLQFSIHPERSDGGHVHQRDAQKPRTFGIESTVYSCDFP